MPKDFLWMQKVQSILKADLWDLREWLKMAKALPSVKASNERAAQDFGGQPVQESFFGLFKRDPQLQDEVPGDLQPL